jgi:hypothetical protein
VSDTSPIRALAHLDLLAVLETLFDQIVVPPAVDTELLHPPVGLPQVNVRKLVFVEIQTPGNLDQVLKLMATLDPGESEALALALEPARVRHMSEWHGSGRTLHVDLSSAPEDQRPGVVAEIKILADRSCARPSGKSQALRGRPPK